VDSSENELFSQTVDDINPLELVLVEAELIDVESDHPAADPERGLKTALAYAEKEMPVIIIGKKKYPKLDIWKLLVKRKNVIFLKKPVARKKFIQAIKKIIPKFDIEN
jgi:FixJ family two-component response regulator